MSIEDMEGFTTVTNSTHPEEELFHRPRAPIKPHDAALKRGAPIRWKFTNEGEPNLEWDTIKFDYAIPFVRAFSDDGSSTWVDVIVPGLGRCKVQRDNLEFQTADGNVARESSGGVTSLRIGFTEEDGDIWEGLPMFLAAVGSSLTFLGLDYHEGGFDDILQNGPNLQELTFYGGFAFFRFNFSECNGENDQVEYKWRDLEKLVQALSDKSSPFSRCLRRVRVKLDALTNGKDENGKTVYDPSIEMVVAAFQQMLEVNQSLEYLDAHLPPPYHDCIDNFRAYHLKLIRYPRRPLSSECKLSFLSVILPRTPLLTRGMADYVNCARCDLDLLTLSNIFEFAAPATPRQVFARKSFENEIRSVHQDESI